MKNSTPLASTAFAALSVALLLSGCASDTGSDAPNDNESVAPEMTEETTEQSGAELGRRYHFDVVNPSAEWRPGCGIVRDGQPPCQHGLFLTFTRTYADLYAGYSIRIDNARNVITVTTDTWSNSTVHSRRAVRPETVKLNPPNLAFDRHYAVVIKNYRGSTLVTNWVYTALAP